MKRILPVLFLLILCNLSSQEIKSPSEFLGYELGTRFTFHHKFEDYYQYLSDAARDRVQLNEYGKTNEGRALLLAYISTPENMVNLEEIRIENLKSTN